MPYGKIFCLVWLKKEATDSSERSVTTYQTTHEFNTHTHTHTQTHTNTNTNTHTNTHTNKHTQTQIYSADAYTSPELLRIPKWSTEWRKGYLMLDVFTYLLPL